MLVRERESYCVQAKACAWENREKCGSESLEGMFYCTNPRRERKRIEVILIGC